MKRSPISKSLRLEVYNKYGGLCAYSGTPLEEGWQVDHLIPVRAYNGQDANDISNLVPCQGIINHYKRCLLPKTFRTKRIATLHLRLAKLPKNPTCMKSIKHKTYLLTVARYFNITSEKPFKGLFYYEGLKL